MTIDEMTRFIKVENPITFNSIRVEFKDKSFEVGFFVQNDDVLNLENKWRFIPNNLASKYQRTKSVDDSIIINGDDVVSLTML